MRDTHREKDRDTGRDRQREKQAPCREPDVGLDPGTPGSRPGLKAGAKPLSHPGCPNLNFRLLRLPSCHLCLIVRSFIFESPKEKLWSWKEEEKEGCVGMSGFMVVG
ncbi:hypothetical protein VULLAG_LOCUS15027 [Vulpes lagopus]